MSTSVILLMASFVLSLVGRVEHSSLPRSALSCYGRHESRRYRHGEPQRRIRVPEKVRIESKKQHSEIPRSSR